GAFVFGPRDVPHTFIVSSEQARFLLVTEPAGFEGFIRALAVAARTPEIPPPPTAPPDMAPVLKAAAEHGLAILGPPGIPTCPGNALKGPTVTAQAPIENTGAPRERNRPVARRWIDAFNARDDAAETASRTADYTAHAPESIEAEPLDGDAWVDFLGVFLEG